MASSKSFLKVLLLLNVLFFCNASITSFFSELKDARRDNKNYMENENIIRDIKFNKDRTLDVYYDKKHTSELKPVFIFLYGGGWYSGSKIKFTNFGSLLEENDYVAVLPNYVLFPVGSFEDMVDDVYKAIKWTFNNIKKYGGNPKNVNIAAYSAGSHLTALTLLKPLLGYANKNKFLEPLPTLEKVVLLNGPYDFDDYSVIRNVVGKETENSLVENIAKVIFRSKDISPTDLLKPYPDNSIDRLGAKKFIFFYTSKDNQVKESSAINFMKQLRRVNPKVNIQYIYKEGYEHTTLTRGVRAGQEEQENVFLNLLIL
ncbi:hypothetical protein PIROE2DRAFT_5396 [Piromyces sp. E2]|nr:hypothetical protein PIROE2DRAFT_5396 [Piromyces sp. E2]|eukprot:OUM67234.1 hypothetical protein PIROE2DRAFT_5396 [Piromyces sp. E2]